MTPSSQSAQLVTFAQTLKDVGLRMYDAEKLVMDDAVIFPLYTQANAEMMSSSVTGVDFHPCALNRVYKNAVKSE